MSHSKTSYDLDRLLLSPPVRSLPVGLALRYPESESGSCTRSNNKSVGDFQDDIQVALGNFQLFLPGVANTRNYLGKTFMGLTY